ncbi:nuclear transport factor 2 family protein [Streptomyces sp. NPDC093252]|uniref:nuclear transport factor 2 family protein n=1 Tax=Streptomyces sp. NPDC093252 TaxID=3154980 RepID=UPI00342972E8
MEWLEPVTDEQYRRTDGRALTGNTAHGTSAAPADVVRRQYLASVRGDLDALRATLADDVEWTAMAGFPLAGTYRTPDAVVSGVMERLAKEWSGLTVHDDTYVVEGEDVVVLARYTGTHRGTGKALDVRVAHHFVVRGGLIVRFEQFVDTAKFLAATIA